MANLNGNFRKLTPEQYQALATPAMGTFYLVVANEGLENETRDLYIGNRKLSNADDITAAVAALDSSVSATAVEDESGNVNVLTGVTQVDGVLTAKTEQLIKKVAVSGNAEDLAIAVISGLDNNGTPIADVQAALAKLTAMVTATGNDSRISIDDTRVDSEYAKVYDIYQGDITGLSGAELLAKRVGTINIPKDMVVSSGSIVDITFDSANNQLKEEGVDVTVKITSGTPTAADAGKYVKLVIANATNDTLYIKATDLVDVYTANNQTAEVTVSIVDNNITATIGKVSATKVVYKEATAGQGNVGDPDYVAPTAEVTVKDALDIINGNASTAGSIEKAKADVIGYGTGKSESGGVTTYDDTIVGAKAYTDDMVAAVASSFVWEEVTE